MGKRFPNKRARDKGDRPERELVALFHQWGLEARRVPLPGAARESEGPSESGGTSKPEGDADIYKIGRDPPLVGECKTQKDGFKQLYAWLESDGADYLALRAEHAEWLFVLPERVMRELLTQ